METEVIKLLISSYFSLSKRTLIDMVPKGEHASSLSTRSVSLLTELCLLAAIMLNLVFHCKETLQRELLAELYRPDVMEDALKESDSVVTRRKECVKMIAALTRAEAVVANV